MCASDAPTYASIARAYAFATLKHVAARSYSAAAASQSGFHRPSSDVFLHLAPAAIAASPSLSLRASIFCG